MGRGGGGQKVYPQAHPGAQLDFEDVCIPDSTDPLGVDANWQGPRSVRSAYHTMEGTCQSEQRDYQERGE